MIKLSFWWFSISFRIQLLKVIRRVLFEKSNDTYIFFSYFGMSSTLVLILLNDNARPHVAKVTLQKLIDLGYKTWPHPLYSPDLSPSDNHFPKHQDTFLRQKHNILKEKQKLFLKISWHPNL